MYYVEDNGTAATGSKRVFPLVKFHKEADAFLEDILEKRKYGVVSTDSPASTILTKIADSNSFFKESAKQMERPLADTLGEDSKEWRSLYKRLHTYYSFLFCIKRTRALEYSDLWYISKLVSVICKTPDDATEDMILLNNLVRNRTMDQVLSFMDELIESYTPTIGWDATEERALKAADIIKEFNPMELPNVCTAVILMDVKMRKEQK